jgi:hypothetical protein
VPKMLASLPNQFNEPTTKTIENIDVLWLSSQAIVAAFEVEHTTAVYSGLLRMSDLLTMQPNLDINLYLVGPDDRYAKVNDRLTRLYSAQQDAVQCSTRWDWICVMVVDQRSSRCRGPSI